MDIFPRLRAAFLCFAVCAALQTALAQHTNARFEQLSPVPIGGRIFSISVADVNNDGKSDVVVGLRDTSQIAVYLGNGDGTFQNPLFTSVTLGTLSSPIPTPIVLEDVNGDGKLDAIIGEANIYTIEVHLGNGDGTFQSTAVISPVTFNGNDICNPEVLAVADLDGDLHKDLVVGGNGSTVILFGMGDGTFAARSNTSYANGFLNTSPTLIDLNKDGKLDLISANRFANKLSVALGNGDGTFQPETTYTGIWDTVEQILTGDFDGDGNVDVLALSFQSNGATFLKGSANGTLTASQSALLFVGGPGAAVDLDGDHIADLVTTNTQDGFDKGWIDVQYGSANGKFTANSLQFTAATGGIFTADFNGDGLPDLVYNNVQDQTFTVLLQTLKAVGTLTVTSSANPAAPGQSLTFTATATGQAGSPTGTVTFKSDGAILGTAPLDSNGMAAFTTSSLASGVHLIFASYNGDANYAGAGSLSISQTVQNATVTDLGVTIQPTGAVNGGAFSFVVTVKNNGPATATSLVLNNALSGPFLFQSFTRSVGLICGNGPNSTPQNPKLVCKLSSLASGATATLTLSGPTSATGTLLDTASVYALQTDSDHTNDSAMASISVINPAPTITSISPGASSIGAGPLSIVLTGTGFVNGSQVLLDGVPIATQASNSATTLFATIPSAELLTMRTIEITVVNSAPGGGTSNQFGFVTFRSLSLDVRDMVYDPFKKKIFATVNQDSPEANSIYEIDPFTGTVESKTPIGSIPRRIAISDDGQAIYVALDGAFSVRRFDPFNLVPGNQFSVGVNTDLGSQPGAVAISDIAVMPGNANTVAIAASSGINLFDNGVKRPNPIAQTVLPFSALSFGGSPSTLFGINNFNEQVLEARVDANGLTLNQTVPIPNSNGLNASRSAAVGGKLFFDDSVLLDLLSNTAARYPGPAYGSITSDSGKAYHLSGGSFESLGIIDAIDPATSSITGTLTIQGTPNHSPMITGPFVRWGNDGFAFGYLDYLTYQLIFVRSSITGAQPLGSADLGLSFSATPLTVSIGDTIDVTANLFNNGPDASSDAVVTFGLPSNWILNSAMPSRGRCSISVPVVCKLGTIASTTGDTVTLSMTAASAGDSLFAARIESPEADTNLSNNGGSADIVVSAGAPLNPVPVISYALDSANSIASLPEGSADTIIRITGSNFLPTSVAMWNGQQRTTTYQNPQGLIMSVTAADLASYGEFSVSVQNPGPGGGVSASVTFEVVRTLNFKTNSLVFDVFRNKFYAAIASGDAHDPNSIITIDPDTGAISNPIAVGNDPRNLIVTGDGNSLYFSTLNGSAGAVQRINLASSAVSTVFTNTGTSGIAEFPGRHDSIVVLNGTGFFGTALTVFDNGVQRAGAVSLSGPPQGDPISVGFDSARNVYAQGQRFAINGSGVTLVGPVPHSTNYSNPGGAFSFDGGHLFYFGGTVSDASTYEQEAQLEAVDTYAFLYEGLGDASAQRAYYRGDAAIYIFDISTFQQTGRIPSANPVQFIHWDSDKLAIVTSSGTGQNPSSQPNISFLQSPQIAGITGNPRPAISSITPDSSPLNGPDLSITVTGVNFVATSQVKLNGSAVATNYIGATQLSATVPAASLSQPGAAYLTVVNPSPAGGESNQMIVKVVPPSISVSSLAPNNQGKGHLDFPITVTGANFTPDSVVTWNGSARVTQFVSGTQLTATIKAADVVTEGSANVAVTDWIAGTSNISGFNINPAPQATLVNILSNFSTQRVGKTSPALTTTLMNSGDDVLQITSISVPSPFNAASDCGPTLAVGASCTISVTVTPTQATSYTGSLSIISNSSAPPVAVNYFAFGAAPNFQFGAASITFQAQKILTSSTSQFFFVNNNGNYPLIIQNVKVTGDFEVVNNCPTPLNAFFGCSMSVVFHPTHGGGTLNGSLIITADDSINPHVLPLSGTVIDIALSVPRLSRTARGGAPAHVKTAEISVAGYVEQPVHLTCGPLPTGVQCQFGEQDFQLNGSKTVAVSMVSMNRRAGRLSAATVAASKSLRIAGEAATSQGATNVEVTATSGSIKRSITVPLSLP